MNIGKQMELHFFFIISLINLFSINNHMYKHLFVFKYIYIAFLVKLYCLKYVSPNILITYYSIECMPYIIL